MPGSATAPYSSPAGHAPVMPDGVPPAIRNPRWADLVFTVGSAFFSVALVPSLLDPASKVSLWTSLPTAGFLVLFSATKWRLHLRLASVSEAVTAVMWVLMAVFRN